MPERKHFSTGERKIIFEIRTTELEDGEFERDRKVESYEIVDKINEIIRYLNESLSEGATK